GLPRLPHGDTSFLSSRFKELSSAESPEPAEETAAEAEPAQRCLRLLSALSAPAREQCRIQNEECRISNAGNHAPVVPASAGPICRRKLSSFLFGQRTRALAALEKLVHWEGERRREPLDQGSSGASPSLLDLAKEDESFATLVGVP